MKRWAFGHVSYRSDLQSLSGLLLEPPGQNRNHRRGFVVAELEAIKRRPRHRLAGYPDFPSISGGACSVVVSKACMACKRDGSQIAVNRR